MALTPFEFDRRATNWRASVTLLGVWALWLCFLSTFRLLPLRLSLDATSLILLLGAFWWSIPQAALYIFVMSLLYTAFSLTPPGYFWVGTFLLFIPVKFASYRVGVTTWMHVALGLFVITLCLKLLEAILLAQILERHVLGFRVVGSIFMTAILQSIVGLLFSRPLLRLLKVGHETF